MPCITYEDDSPYNPGKSAFESLICYLFSKKLPSPDEFEGVLDSAEEEGFLTKEESQVIVNWWRDHKKKDKEKQSLEKKKKMALAKLSPEERKILGL